MGQSFRPPTRRECVNHTYTPGYVPHNILRYVTHIHNTYWDIMLHISYILGYVIHNLHIGTRYTAGHAAAGCQ